MREIKFRAFVDEVMQYNVMLNMHGSYGVFDNGKLIVALPDVPVMQYTGLKDKNGYRIYEGDIIKNHWSSSTRDISSTWVVRFGEHTTSDDYYASPAYGWYAEAIKSPTSETEHSLHNIPTDRDDGIEVIGNIWENPELLNN